MYGTEWGKKLIYVIEKEWMYGQIKFQFKKKSRYSKDLWLQMDVIAMECEFSKRAYCRMTLAFQK